MARTIFTLSLESIRELKRQVERLRHQVHNMQRLPLSGRLERDSYGSSVFIGKTDANGITAASGDTAGSGEVTVYKRAGNTATISTAGFTVTAYSLSEAAVAASANVGIVRDAYGTWWVIFENCGA